MSAKIIKIIKLGFVQKWGYTVDLYEHFQEKNTGKHVRINIGGFGGTLVSNRQIIKLGIVGR